MKQPSELISHRIAELGDWRGETLGRMRKLIKEADADVVEEWKWGVPVWSHGGILCTGETYKSVVKLTFAKGASFRPGRSAVPDVANVGIARPPLVYVAASVVGSVLELAWPTGFLPHAVAIPLGSACAVAAVGLFLSSLGRFRAAGTPVPGNRPTTAIVRTGPYRFSRNPIYLALAVTIMSMVVIPREERYLERKFGESYLAYKSQVRRWR